MQASNKQMRGKIVIFASFCCRSVCTCVSGNEPKQQPKYIDKFTLEMPTKLYSRKKRHFAVVWFTPSAVFSFAVRDVISHFAFSCFFFAIRFSWFAFDAWTIMMIVSCLNYCRVARRRRRRRTISNMRNWLGLFITTSRTSSKKSVEWTSASAQTYHHIDASNKLQMRRKKNKRSLK